MLNATEQHLGAFGVSKDERLSICIAVYAIDLESYPGRENDAFSQAELEIRG